jgi:hypothetical protein
MKGYAARTQGVAIEANPYLVTDPDHEAWDMGWRVHDVVREHPALTEADMIEHYVGGKKIH